MNNNEIFKLLQTVQRNVRCPQCGRQYLFSDIKIRGLVDAIYFLELNCSGHMPLIATVMLNQTPGVKKQVLDNSTIKINDVIEMHKFLKKFNGNFDHLFKEKNNG
jgi:hypothetical protein